MWLIINNVNADNFAVSFKAPITNSTEMLKRDMVKCLLQYGRVLRPPKKKKVMIKVEINFKEKSQKLKIVETC